MVKKVAILTAGGFAPCLSSAIGGLVQRYTEVAPEVEIIAYKHGYQGFFKVTTSLSTRPSGRRRTCFTCSAVLLLETLVSSSPMSRTLSSAVWSQKELTRSG